MAPRHSSRLTSAPQGNAGGEANRGGGAQIPQFPKGNSSAHSANRRASLQGGDHACDHSISGRWTHFQHVQHRPVAEARIGSHPELPNVGRAGEKTGGQQCFAARPGSGIATPQFDIPQKRSLPPRKARIVTAAAIAWIVANLRTSLVAKSGNHGAVQVEEQTSAMLRQVDEPLQQSIIHAA